MTKKLYLRFSSQADEDRIFDFYKKHPHAQVFMREPSVWKERIRNGAVTYIEDADGKIVASTISYPVRDQNGNHKWTEIGSTRVAIGNIGLFRPLIAAQLLRAFFFEPPSDRFVAEIVPGNTHSMHAFKKLGAKDYDIPDEAVAAIQGTIAPQNRGRTMDWISLDASVMPRLAQILMETQRAPVFKGGEYEMDFSRCPLLKALEPSVKKLAGEKPSAPELKDIRKGFRP